MANVKISALPVATTPLAGTEVLPIVQSGTTVKVSVADLTAGRAISASDLALTNALGIAYGGTGQITANASFNALAPSQTGNSGKYLTTDGANTSWATNPLGTVTSITAGTGLTGGTITTSGTIAIDNTVATLTGTQTLTNKTISGASNTLSNIANASLTNSAITINGTSTSLGGSISVGTVTSVTGTAPVSVATGTSTPVISMAAANTTTNGYLTSTDWNTFNGKSNTNGTVTSVAALTLGTTGTDLTSTVATGTTTPVITLNVPTASASNRGVLSSADWTTFNNKGSGSVTSVALTAPSIFTVTGSPVTTSGTLALTYSGTALPILNGGTGQTTAAAAFNALSPMTTTGDIVYEASASTAARLAIGTTGQVLTVVSGLPAWATSASTIATNLAGGTTGAVPYQSGVATTSFLSGNTTTTPNFYTSTGTGALAQAPTLTASTGSGSVVLATSPTLVTPALGTPSALVGTNITGTASGLSIGGTAALATSLASGVAGAIPWQSAAGTTGFTAAGTSGQILQSNGTSVPTWVTFSGGATITATTSNTAYYLVGTSSISGSLSTASISTTSPVSYNASTGTLSAPVHYASQGFHTNANTNTVSYTIPASTNAMTVGPYTVASSTTITVTSGARWVIL
jgi:hypothetical protein